MSSNTTLTASGTATTATTTAPLVVTPSKGLREMSYKELQTECKQLKISAKGDAKALVERIATKRRESRATAVPTASGSLSAAAGMLSGVAFTGVSGGFDGVEEPEDDGSDAIGSTDADTDDSAGGARSAGKSRCPPFLEDEMVRLAHCLADPGCQSALGRIIDGETKDDLDDKTAPSAWDDVAQAFNDPNLVFSHIEQTFTECEHEEHSWWCGTPRNSTERLKPNPPNRQGRDGQKLRRKWTEMRAFLSDPMRRWNKSGEQNPDRSPSDFIGDDVAHKRVVKYLCLLFQGNEDLLDFSSRVMAAGVAKDCGDGRESAGAGAAKYKDGEQSGTSSKKRKAELELLREIFAEQEADRDLAAAAKLQAAAAQAEAAGAAQRIWNATLTSLTQSRRDLAGIPGIEEHVATIDAQIREHLSARPKTHDPTSATVVPTPTAARASAQQRASDIPATAGGGGAAPYLE